MDVPVVLTAHITTVEVDVPAALTVHITTVAAVVQAVPMAHTTMEEDALDVETAANIYVAGLATQDVIIHVIMIAQSGVTERVKQVVNMINPVASAIMDVMEVA